MDREASPDRPLDVLLIEDSAEDAELILRALRGMDRVIAHRRVASAEALTRALAESVPDLILSDYSMPGFSGHEAMFLAREQAPDVPFIFVSGTIGEEAAIDALQRGAVDYVIKGNLRRLPAAIDNALRNVDERARRQAAEEALKASETRLRSIVEATRDWVWEIDENELLIYSNDNVEAILGYPAADLIGKDTRLLLIDADRAAMAAEAPDLEQRRRESGWSGWLLHYRHRDGGTRWLESSAAVRRDKDGRFRGFRGVDRDISLRVQHEARIQQLARIHAMLSALGNAVVRSGDREQLISSACSLAVEFGGFTRARISARTGTGAVGVLGCHGESANDRDLDLAYDRCLAAQPGQDASAAARALAENRMLVVEDIRTSELSRDLRQAAATAGIHALIALPLGEEPWGELTLFKDRAHHFDEEEIALLQRLAANIDFGCDFIAKSERLEFLAYHNPVTGLPNRTAFHEHLRARLGNGPMTVGVLDIVRFHYFNDSRGHAFGDRLLAAVGERLADLLGQSALIAHPIGNSFMFARPARDTLAECLQDIENLVATCCATPLNLDGENVFIALRGALVRTPDHGTDVETIERNVVSALSEAAKRDQPLLAYSEEMHDRSARRVELERELREALDKDQFEIFLQPKFEAKSRRLTGAEALLRWRHPSRGLVSPAEFIPVLEETGLITRAGHWVMSSALRILDRWRASGLPGYRIAVNVSARELHQQGFVEACRALLEARDGDHGLDVELTESLLMDNVAHNIHVLNALRELGCGIAIDDFGTGYSSLSYLSRLPVDVLKIDRSFTSQIANSSDTLSLVTNIIGLAHSLDLKVVAEGVEDEEQEKLLRLLRCDELQGYLLGRPVPVADFERMLLG